MSNNFYGSQRGRSKMVPPRAGANELVMPSPLEEGKKITWQRKTIPSAEIWELCVPSKHNPRNRKYLNESTLADLIDQLEKTKANSDFARAFKSHDGKLHILSGLRRATALSLIEGGALQIEYSDDLTEDEQKHFARISEGQRKLSSYEQVMLLANEELDLDKKLTVDEAAELLKESRSKISVIRKYMAIPESIYERIGHPDYISFDAVDVLTQALSVDSEDSVLQALESAGLKSLESSECEADIEKYKKYITKTIKDALKPKPKRLSRAPELSSVWSSLPKSVTAKRTTRGELAIKIGSDSVSEELEEKLVKLLAEHIQSQ